jgi:hypothetical protein
MLTSAHPPREAASNSGARHTLSLINMNTADGSV